MAELLQQRRDHLIENRRGCFRAAVVRSAAIRDHRAAAITACREQRGRKKYGAAVADISALGARNGGAIDDLDNRPVKRTIQQLLPQRRRGGHIVVRAERGLELGEEISVRRERRQRPVTDEKGFCNKIVLIAGGHIYFLRACCRCRAA